MQRLVKHAPLQETDWLPNALRIGTLIADHKGVDVRAYDVHELTLVADCFIMATARSEPHLKAIFNAVKEGMKEVGVAPLHVEGQMNGGWLVVDYGTVVVHLFREEARAFYDLDGLWGDAPPVDLELDE